MATQPQGIAPQRTRARLRIRQGAPSTSALRVGYVEAGMVFHPVGEIAGEAVAGNARWFRLADNRFVWSGASSAVPAEMSIDPPIKMQVHRRKDNGAVAVLPDEEREAIFGTFPYDPAGKGAIKIDSGWVSKNIVQIDTPLLAEEKYPRIWVHRLAADPFRRVFEKIAAAGLDDDILTCAGTWVPRHKGWNPKRGLSSHSWGIAIDLNVRWNGYGVVPPAIGEVGTLRNIVPIFESEGFAWGGYFQPAKDCDGMHFELARRDLKPS